MDCVVWGRNLVARPVGELDLAVADRFRAELEHYLAVGGVRTLVLNLSRVSFIDSSGLGVILGRYRYLRSLGGQVAIVRPSPPVNRLLELAGLHRLMRFYDSEEEALGSLERGSGE